jgi:hypothetical protein
MPLLILKNNPKAPYAAIRGQMQGNTGGDSYTGNTRTLVPSLAAAFLAMTGDNTGQILTFTESGTWQSSGYTGSGSYSANEDQATFTFEKSSQGFVGLVCLGTLSDGGKLLTVTVPSIPFATPAVYQRQQ